MNPRSLTKRMGHIHIVVPQVLLNWVEQEAIKYKISRSQFISIVLWLRFLNAD